MFFLVKDETGSAWLFVTFAFFLNIPAILLCWVKPRFAAYWILLNIAVSMVIGVAIGVEGAITRYSDAVALHETGFPEALDPLARLVAITTLICLPPLAFALGILRALQRSGQQSAETTAPETNLNG